MKKIIQSFFVKSSINRILRNNNKGVLKPFKTFSKTKKIGIIFNGFKKENIDLTRQLIDYFKEKGISCEALGFVNEKKMLANQLGIKLITEDDFLAMIS